MTPASPTTRPNDIRAHPFYGRRAVIVTKHGKERVLSPILYAKLRMFGEVLIIDTDVFGTFTGEVERQGSQLDALRSKLRSGAKLTRYDAILVADEGSFSPDPSFPFITLNRELVGMYDPVDDLEIIGIECSRTTNMTSMRVDSVEDLESALGRIKFPSHAVIVRRPGSLAKGIRDRDQVFDLVEASWAVGESPILESDMRARYNPTRMSVIARAGENAVERALSLCPHCEQPGFWIATSLPGLLCRECGEGTTLPLAYLWKCNACDFAQEQPCDGTADAQHCGRCNP